MNCQYNENTVLVTREVQQELAKFIKVKLWTDKPAPVGPAAVKLRGERFKTAALPFYAVLSPSGQEVARIEGRLLSKENFVAWLQKAEADAHQ